MPVKTADLSLLNSLVKECSEYGRRCCPRRPPFVICHFLPEGQAVDAKEGITHVLKFCLRAASKEL